MLTLHLWLRWFLKYSFPLRYPFLLSEASSQPPLALSLLCLVFLFLHLSLSLSPPFWLAVLSRFPYGFHLPLCFSFFFTARISLFHLPIHKAAPCFSGKGAFYSQLFLLPCLYTIICSRTGRGGRLAPQTNKLCPSTNSLHLSAAFTTTQERTRTRVGYKICASRQRGCGTASQFPRTLLDTPQCMLKTSRQKG